MKTFLGTKLTILIALLVLLDLGISVALMVIYPQGYHVFGILGALGMILICYITAKFLIPRLTTNKEVLSILEEEKNVVPEIKKFPDFYKVRIAQLVAIFAVIIFGIISFGIKSLRFAAWFGLFAIVAIFMRYYINFLKKHPETEQYAIKMKSLQGQSESFFLKYALIGLAVGLFMVVIFYFFYFLPKMNELKSYNQRNYYQIQN